MNLKRGDILKARFPHASGGRGKKRPVVVVQADTYNQRLRHAVVAQITTNLSEKGDPAYLPIEVSTPEGRQAGLDRDGLICCTMLSLMTEDRLQEKIGRLSPELLVAFGRLFESRLRHLDTTLSAFINQIISVSH